MNVNVVIMNIQILHKGHGQFLYELTRQCHIISKICAFLFGFLAFSATLKGKT